MQRQLVAVQGEADFKKKVLRRSELTKVEISEFSEDVVSYKAVGRMCVVCTAQLRSSNVPQICQVLRA